MQTLFACLITVQFVVVALHDMVDIPGWTHGSLVKSVIGRRNFWLGTLINAVFPGLAAGYAIYFWSRSKPAFVTDYWAIYCALTLAAAIGMWWIPYWLGASEQKKVEYARMYAGTRHVLPPRGDNPRPNVLHLWFHALFAVNFFLALVLRFGRG